MNTRELSVELSSFDFGPITVIDKIMFSPEVKERAMVACGRHCCLCQKFVGVGMECHHIVPEAKGGDDTFENCIPLCLSCHAIVGHYNDAHPKGTKFSPDELRGHRDQCYAKRSSNVLETERAKSQKLSKSDRALFQKYESHFGGRIFRFLREHDMGAPFDAGLAAPFHQYVDQWKGPEFEFVDGALEAQRLSLHEAVRKFTWGMAFHTYYHGDVLTMELRDWEPDPDQLKIRDTLNELGNQAADAYESFVRFGRRRLAQDED